jgi:hypothetical protein
VATRRPPLILIGIQLTTRPVVTEKLEEPLPNLARQFGVSRQCQMSVPPSRSAGVVLPVKITV